MRTLLVAALAATVLALSGPTLLGINAAQAAPTSMIPRIDLTTPSAGAELVHYRRHYRNRHYRHYRYNDYRHYGYRRPGVAFYFGPRFYGRRYWH